MLEGTQVMKAAVSSTFGPDRLTLSQPFSADNLCAVLIIDQKMMATRWHGNGSKGDAREPRGRRDQQRYRCEGAARVHNNPAELLQDGKWGGGGKSPPSEIAAGG